MSKTTHINFDLWGKRSYNFQRMNKQTHRPMRCAVSGLRNARKVIVSIRRSDVSMVEGKRKIRSKSVEAYVAADGADAPGHAHCLGIIRLLPRQWDLPLPSQSAQGSVRGGSTSEQMNPAVRGARASAGE